VFGTMLYTGTLFAPMLGVVSDRTGHRLILSGMRAIFAAVACTIMACAFAGTLTPTLVCILAAVVGIVRPSDMGLRGAVIADAMPFELLTGAMSLSRSTSDSARIAGALSGAGLAATFGIAPAYAMITGFYALGALLTLGAAPARRVRSMPIAATTARAPDSADSLSPCGGGMGKGVTAVAAPVAIASTRTSPWRDLGEGIRYIWNTPRLLAIVWLAFLINLTAFSITNALLPYVARDVYHVDQTGLGFLSASFAFGALVGSITLSRPRFPIALPRLMILSAVVWHLMLLSFAQMQSLRAGMLFLALAGVMSSLTMISHSVILLSSTEARFRGRVLGVRMLAVYSLPLGLLIAGALIERLGFRATVSFYALAGIAFTALIAARWGALRWQTRTIDPEI
jgi:MFS family permease